jgi:hypothetical protein
LAVLGVVGSLVPACGSGDDTTGNPGDDASTGDDSSTKHDAAPGKDASGGSDSGGDSTVGGDAGSDGAGDDGASADGAGSDGGGDGASFDGASDSAGADSGGVDGSTSDGGSNDGSASDGAISDGGDAGDGSSVVVEAGICGPCPTGFACGPGNYCANGNGVPAFGHVYVIVMENESQTAIQGSSQAPYINKQLLANYAFTNHYSTTYHPSLPNYIDMTSGSTQKVGCDCAPAGITNQTCNVTNCIGGLVGSCDCPLGAQHIGDQLDTAGVEWREYAESMKSACNPSAKAPFAAKHVPFLYYTDVYDPNDTTRCDLRVRDYATDFATDLAAQTYRFSYISPNLCSDMHGDGSCPLTPSSIRQGDDWLSMEVPKILATPGFGTNGTDVLFIVWDEQTGSVGGTSTPMLLIAVSPLAKQGASNTLYNHESLLATIEDTFSVPRLGGAATAPPISDMWK